MIQCLLSRDQFQRPEVDEKRNCMMNKVVEKPRLLFIIGEGHSGSTILDTILSSHSQIFGVGEVYALARTVKTGELCCCGEPVESCEFWSKIRFDEKWREKLGLIPRLYFSMLSPFGWLNVLYKIRGTDKCLQEKADTR